MTARTLEDRVAIVTGAARGIGLATAATLLDRGARVVLADIDGEVAAAAAADLDATGERVASAHVDVAEQPSVAALVDGSPGALERGHRRAAELAERDAIFPDVVPAIAAALGGSRSLVVG